MNPSWVVMIFVNHFTGDGSAGSNFSFFSSFQGNLLAGGLGNQIGWGHVWNRFAGPLSCRGQPHQCAFTPLLPPAWWDGLWQSPIPRDINRLALYGIKLSGLGTIDEDHLLSFCNSKKKSVRTVTILVNWGASPNIIPTFCAIDKSYWPFLSTRFVT